LKKSMDHLVDSGLIGLFAVKKPLFKLALPFLVLPKLVKRFVAFCVDFGLCVLTGWLVYSLRLDEFLALSGSALLAVSALISIALPIFITSGHRVADWTK